MTDVFRAVVVATIEAPVKSVVEDATAVINDVVSGRIGEATALASLGGSSGSNCRRDYNRMIDKLDFGLELYWFTAPLQDPLNKFAVSDTLVPILLPHELIFALYNLGWSAFSSVLFGGIPEGVQSVRARRACNI